METQIEILKKIASSLSTKLQDMQSQILSQLEGKLRTASLVIEQLMNEKRTMEKQWKHDDKDLHTKMRGLVGMKASNKFKYVLKKQKLHTILEDVEKWQVRYDPSWILIMQSAIGNIDEELHDQQEKPEREKIPIILAAKGVRDALRFSPALEIKDQKSIWIEANEINLDPYSISNSSAQVSTLDGQSDMVLIDSMVSNAAANINSTMKDVRNLARILAEVDPSTFGLLRCRGVIKVPRYSISALHPVLDYKFIFNIPEQLAKPQSLRTLLLSGTSYPLHERLNLAKKLTSSILFLHTAHFVHKNIRSETIVVFQNAISEIGAPFLAGFEHFRVEDGETFFTGDDEWEKTLYRHPSRQGVQPEVSYRMQHDIYSLGVVLLEIGLWTSFTVPRSNHDDKGTTASTRSSILGALGEEINPFKAAIETKTRLESLAEEELPIKLGRKYTDIVLRCLRVLDSPGGDEDSKTGFGIGLDLGKEENDAADQGQLIDGDGVVIGVRYIENVLEKMQDINV